MATQYTPQVVATQQTNGPLVQSIAPAELAVLAANQQLDLHALNRQLQRDLEMADPERARALFPDCDPRALPPLAEPYGVKAIVDERLYTQPDAADLLDQLVLNPVVCLDQPPVRLADAAGGHRVFADAGLAPDVANSFLVVAGPSDEPPHAFVRGDALAWLLAQPRPSRSRTPGRKFSTSTSAPSSSRSIASSPSSVLRSRTTARLLRPTTFHMNDSPSCGSRQPMPRVPSPLGDSTLMTSAPKSARERAQPGPATTVAQSITRRAAGGRGTAPARRRR